MTPHPAGEWVAQQARNLLMNLEDRVGQFRWLVRVRRGVRRCGNRGPAHSGAAPRANADAERWVGTVRREVLGRMLIFGRRHLVDVMVEFAGHYNLHRPHRALGQASPPGPGEPVVLAPAGRVLRRDRLGGLIHEYAQVA